MAKILVIEGELSFLVKELTETLGGMISVESQPEEDGVFSVKFPIEPWFQSFD